MSDYTSSGFANDLQSGTPTNTRLLVRAIIWCMADMTFTEVHSTQCQVISDRTK